jgi:hypothetical protein
MANSRTCGQGLAEHAPLPAKLGELTAAVSDILERHTKALDLTDGNSKREYDAYRDLVRKHRGVANQLQETAMQMAGYRDLPMGRHDMKAMASPEVIEAFERFVRIEQELLALLKARLEEDRHMLVEMAKTQPSSVLPVDGVPQ